MKSIIVGFWQKVHYSNCLKPVSPFNQSICLQCVDVCVPLVNKACAKRQLVVFPQLDTLNAVTLEVNTHSLCSHIHTHCVCTQATRRLSKWYWFCPVFNLFSLITPRSSITLTDEHGVSLKSHPHANTNICSGVQTHWQRDKVLR